MRAVAYVNKFLRAKGGGGNNFKNLNSLLGLKPVLVPPKFLGRFTPLSSCRHCADRAQNLPGPVPGNVLKSSPDFIHIGSLSAEL